ncbi:hypothetical protein DSCW_01960 [Desulfosarcina widdelii]|uniref:Tyr recombinase domain-containing protein n=1 Tax=Desulfosarcina widdelii TaxID=947919 RepID=A0A5K7YXM4_9BACT|nr:hypothetical protein DSCW_01960 [Desulfosarcina widdelii]
MLVALYSGMRQAEIFNLKKADVKIKDRYLLATDTKTHKNRKVPINDTLMAVLKRRLGVSDSDYVFCTSRGKKLTQLTNAYWYAVKEAKLIKYDGDEMIRFRFHDLRHTFGSRLGMAGADLKTIMEIMGHERPKTAMRYQHPAPDHKMAVVKTLDQVPSKSTTGQIEEIKNIKKAVG